MRRVRLAWLVTVALGCEIELLRLVVGTDGKQAPHVRP